MIYLHVVDRQSSVLLMLFLRRLSYTKIRISRIKEDDTKNDTFVER